MDDVQNDGVEQEIVQTETAPPQTEARHEDVPEQEAPPAEDKSWISKLRRDRDDAVRKSRMQDELIAKLMTPQQQYQAQDGVVEEDVLSDLSKEEFVPGEKVAKAYRKLEEKFEKKIQEIEKKSAVQAMNSRYSDLQKQYPDLTEVVNRETLEVLATNNPQIGAVLDGKSDYEIYVLAYPLIKNSGILDQMKGVSRRQETDRKLEQNKKTVPSPQSFDKRPIAQAFNYDRLSKEQQNELAREMRMYAAQAPGVKPL